MNWKKMAKNVGAVVKIRPCVRGSAWRDGDWLVRKVDTNSRVMQIEYLPSGHVATLGSDALHCWDDDYSGPNRGFLRLKRLLILSGCNIEYAVLPRRFWG